ncbi:MAG: extracellular solute-binding protein [Clostridiales bacterium]|jgi:ABC-type glycerol-3-phosphate transport system substrate-binding protein|nr:extracellular solute-binding protein [Clostridiales bacterium]
MSVTSIFKKKSFYFILIIVLAIIGYLVYVQVMNARYEASLEDNTVEIPVETEEILGRDDIYSAYLERHKDAIRPDYEVAVDVMNYSSAEMATAYDEYQGVNDVIISGEDGFVEWEVDVPKAGLYNISLDYYPIEGRGIDIERILYINGEMPFSGADTLSFSRIWTDGGEVRMDNRGNEIRPTQTEKPRWESAYLKDYMGYYVEPYSFYFNEGKNTIKLEAVSESMAISNLIIGQKEELLSYNDYIATLDTSNYQNTDPDFSYKKQGEDAEYRSSPTLYAVFDRASSNTEPYSASKIKLNSIGGEQWRVAGQWIEWEIEVPEDGFYNISFKSKQNYNRGLVSIRTVMIDGVTPFKEAANLEFRYDTGWKLTTLSDENGLPYKLPLTKGKHTIRLEVSMGNVGDILNRIDESIFRLNAIYRKILVLTGAKPDQYRDYRIDVRYPEVMVAMEEEIKVLDDIVNDLEEFTGQRGADTAVAVNMGKRLERYVENPDAIPRGMEGFKQDISSLGTAMLNLSNSQLDIDFVYINADGAKLPKVDETFVGKVAHELRSFTASFFEDYSTLGSVYDSGKVIDVWLLSGRDQSTILKNMIDEIFTPATGIGVNVKLIDANTLLPAVVAGTGPDIALSVWNHIPVDYALRDATVDLTQFEDFDEVASEFGESVFVPYEFDNGIYALPETQNFAVMFYRSDIMEEIGAEVPETWDDVLELLPLLQKNNMQFAMPSPERVTNGIQNPDTTGMMSLLYQNGGQLYNDNKTRTLLDTERSVASFEFFTRLYTHYSLPKQYDFVNRFRTGEMPIGIQDFSIFNTLSVFAPEIRGLWEFALVPGVAQEDGTVNHSVPFGGTCSMLLKDADDYDAAWTFLKWWVSSETNTRFGRELESIMGSAARYATANQVAFEELAWSKDDAAVIREQWKWTVGTPNVAGGYSTIRHMINAYRKVTYNDEDPRETLLDYTRTINDEIKYKRKELGLDVD